MPNVISQIATQLPQPTLPQPIRDAGETLRGLIEANAYVGEVENKKHYVDMLCHVFAQSKSLLKRNAVVFVRTDARQFTREATIEALESAFPRKKLRSERFSLPDFSQTALFDSELESKGEIDFVVW
jgi:hypothetical protein